MNDLVEFWEQPRNARTLIAGWQQWADAGDVSSGLPAYLVEHIGARPFGRLVPHGYYLFQIPTTHHLMRPVVKLSDGHIERMDEKSNEFYYAADGDDSVVIFVGDEPQLNHEQYADAFLDAVQALGIERLILLAGVYGAVPYDKDREVSCVYSLPNMRTALKDYAVRFSNYEGGTTIGIYVVHFAEQRGIEAVVLSALVPSYDFSQSGMAVQPVVIGEDYKAWHDLMTRINHLCHLHVDLSDLEEQSRDLIATWNDKMNELAHNMPELNVDEYLGRVRSEFHERPFAPLGDVWIEGLKGLFDNSPEEPGDEAAGPGEEEEEP